MLRNCWVICFCIGRPCNNGKTDIRQTASNHIRSVGYRNVDETQGQKPRPRMSARLPALFRNDLLIFRGEWNLFADYFVSLQRNFNEFLMRREINYVNAEQKVAQIFAFGEFWRRLSHLGKFNTCQWHSACTKFGHSNIFATYLLTYLLTY